MRQHSSRESHASTTLPTWWLSAFIAPHLGKATIFNPPLEVWDPIPVWGPAPSGLKMKVTSSLIEPWLRLEPWLAKSTRLEDGFTHRLLSDLICVFEAAELSGKGVAFIDKRYVDYMYRQLPVVTGLANCSARRNNKRQGRKVLKPTLINQDPIPRHDALGMTILRAPFMMTGEGNTTRSRERREQSRKWTRRGEVESASPPPSAPPIEIAPQTSRVDTNLAQSLQDELTEVYRACHPEAGGGQLFGALSGDVATLPPMHQALLNYARCFRQLAQLKEQPEVLDNLLQSLSQVVDFVIGSVRGKPQEHDPLRVYDSVITLMCSMNAELNKIRGKFTSDEFAAILATCDAFYVSKVEGDLAFRLAVDHFVYVVDSVDDIHPVIKFAVALDMLYALGFPTRSCGITLNSDIQRRVESYLKDHLGSMLSAPLRKWVTDELAPSLEKIGQLHAIFKTSDSSDLTHLLQDPELIDIQQIINISMCIGKLKDFLPNCGQIAEDWEIESLAKLQRDLKQYEAAIARLVERVITAHAPLINNLRRSAAKGTMYAPGGICETALRPWLLIGMGGVDLQRSKSQELLSKLLRTVVRATESSIRGDLLKKFDNATLAPFTQEWYEHCHSVLLDFEHEGRLGDLTPTCIDLATRALRGRSKCFLMNSGRWKLRPLKRILRLAATFFEENQWSERQINYFIKTFRLEAKRGKSDDFSFIGTLLNDILTQNKYLDTFVDRNSADEVRTTWRYKKMLGLKRIAKWLGKLEGALGCPSFGDQAHRTVEQFANTKDYTIGNLEFYVSRIAESDAYGGLPSADLQFADRKVRRKYQLYNSLYAQLKNECVKALAGAHTRAYY